MFDTMWYRKSKRKERRKKIDGIHIQPNIVESTSYDSVIYDSSRYDKQEEEHALTIIR